MFAYLATTSRHCQFAIVGFFLNGKKNRFLEIFLMKGETMKVDIENDILKCPSCDGKYLHHGKVESFIREEDAVIGVHASIDANGWCESKKTKLTNNPSPRRGGLLIHFRCENCNAKPVLSIYQHKGQTLLEMGLVDENISY